MNEIILNRINEKLRGFGRPIFIARTGSHLYGLNTPQSDEDFVGVFIPNKKYLLGFQNIDEVDCSIVSKDESGKNTKEAIDIKMYALPKFLKLASDVNPNIVELLFINDENILLLEDEYKIFMDNYHLFINQRVKYTFKGYAHQQFKKGILKAQNYKELKNILEVIKKYDCRDVLAVIIKDEPLLQKYDKGNFFSIEGLNFQKNIYLKKIEKQIKEKISMSSHRAELWETFGYDTKAFMHLLRLLNEGSELLTKGKLEFPVKDRQFLLNVRRGKYELEFLQEEVEKRFNEFKEMKTDLPEKANIEKIEELLIEVLSKEIEKETK